MAEDRETPPSGEAPKQIEQMPNVLRALRFLPYLTVAHLMIGAPAFLLTVIIAYSTYVQADATRKMQAASAWPMIQIVEIMQANADGDPEKVRTQLAIDSQGMGPAIIRQVSLAYDGRTMGNWDELARTLDVEGPYSQSELMGQAFRPGQDSPVFGLRGKAAVRLHDRLADGRIRLSLCYCSVFDDCWVARYESPHPKAVDSCPAQASFAAP